MPDTQAPPTPSKPARLPSLRRRKQLERDLEHITQEMYKRNFELAETNQTLSLLRSIDRLVLESHDTLPVLGQNITAAIAEHSSYSFVALLAVAHHGSSLNLIGWSSKGTSELALDTRRVKLDGRSEWLTGGSRTKTLHLAHFRDDTIARHINLTAVEVKALRSAVPLQSLKAIKLLARNHIVGVMVIGFPQKIVDLTEKENALLDRLSESVGVALDNRLLFEENQYVLAQLKKSNAKLRALDEAKDDFISMASHQLRTPLTSVKGYISMVMEGDAGKISAKQHEMLGQAFFSSQRMVYLIADLLNVSRLRTGKFVIESGPVNLAQVVEEEIAQLTETAASRSLTLSYDKPKSFPELMLDETKTRQVIMNFVDNAIYYTPAGGHIDVKLVVTRTTVEFRVEDNGIGVPQSEQHHLFTKFYRAGNARQARPDGTGLGLFMAKKVVVGQGGALIFESTEGVGSIFGFVLSKSKLAVSAHPKPAAKSATTFARR